MVTFETMVKKQEEIETLKKAISTALNLLYTAEDKSEYKQKELSEAINTLQTTLK